MATKRALITGITGMVGSHLADYLLENTDWEIYGLCRWRSPLNNLQHLVPRINAKDRLHLVYGELSARIMSFTSPRRAIRQPAFPHRLIRLIPIFRARPGCWTPC